MNQCADGNHGSRVKQKQNTVTGRVKKVKVEKFSHFIDDVRERELVNRSNLADAYHTSLGRVTRLK